MGHRITYSSRLLCLILLALLRAAPCTAAGWQGCDSCGYCCLHIAVKSNLLHDAALTPDLGVEIALPHNFSVGIEGVYAWWSNAARHRYWQIRGGWLDVNYWFGPAVRRGALMGHHAGIYASCHDFDFEFGHKGWQSRCPTFGGGASYGYAFRLNDRLRLDLGVRVGYWGGHVTSYTPRCGRYVCSGRYHRYYAGLTGLAVTLVWFPGRGNINNPAR